MLWWGARWEYAFVKSAVFQSFAGKYRKIVRFRKIHSVFKVLGKLFFYFNSICFKKISSSERKLMARKSFHEKIFVFLVQKSPLPWINTTWFEFLLSLLKSGQVEWEVGRGGARPRTGLLAPVVRLLRPAQTQTSHMCPNRVWQPAQMRGFM